MNKDNEVPDGFKITELGPLPERWKVESLKNINLEKKVNLNPADYPDETFEYYSIPAYQDSSKPILEKGASILSQKIILKNGAVLFGKLNPRVEKVWKVQSDSKYRKIGSTEWIPIFSDDKRVDSDYIYYAEWSKYVMPIAKILVTGSTPSRQRVDPTSFYEIKIPLPPLPEQKKIAAILSAVQSTKEKTEDIIQATKELKKSLMKHLFTYGPVPVEEAEDVPLKETEIGMVPEEWDIVRLGDVVNVYDKKRIPLSSEQRSEMRGYYPYCGANGIIDYINNYIFDGEYLLLAEDGGFWNEFQDTAYLMNGKFWVNNHAHIIKVKKGRSNNRFLLYWFNYDNIESYTSGTTRKKLNQGVMKQIQIPLPPLPTQQKIANILSAIDLKIEAEENKKKALGVLFKTLLHNLMTAKIRVNQLEVET